MPPHTLEGGGHVKPLYTLHWHVQFDSTVIRLSKQSRLESILWTYSETHYATVTRNVNARDTNNNDKDLKKHQASQEVKGNSGIDNCQKSTTTILVVREQEGQCCDRRGILTSWSVGSTDLSLMPCPTLSVILHRFKCNVCKLHADVRQSQNNFKAWRCSLKCQLYHILWNRDGLHGGTHTPTKILYNTQRGDGLQEKGGNDTHIDMFHHTGWQTLTRSFQIVTLYPSFSQLCGDTLHVSHDI